MARGSRCGVPRRPWRAFALLSPTPAGALPPPPPRASPRLPPRRWVLRVGGVRVCSPSAFAFGAGRNPVAAPPALAPWPRRVSGCAAWRRVPVASPRSGSRPSRGASEPRLTRGAPPSAASRRPPWMALRSVGGPSPGPVFLPCASLFAPPRRPYLPTLPSALPSGPGSGPGPAFRLLPRLLPEPPPPRPCPLVPRFPPQPPSRRGGGPGPRVRGRGR